jgi:hypothetical protein
MHFAADAWGDTINNALPQTYRIEWTALPNSYSFYIRREGRRNRVGWREKRAWRLNVDSFRAV